MFQRKKFELKNITRKLVNFDFGNLEIIKSKYDALHFENANGGDIYIYPAFVIVVDNLKKFGLIEIRELNFKYGSQRFLEEQEIPLDSKVVDYTWAKVNKNGSPDKRFKGNYKIPVCLYGEIEMTSKTGLNEAYSLSSNIKTQEFGNSFNRYKELLGGEINQ